MKRTSEQDQIALQGLDLADGCAKRGTCPYCGSSQSFRMSRYDNILFYRCYRASCPTKGAIPLAPGAMTEAKQEKPRQVFRERLGPIPEWAQREVSEKYSINDIEKYARWSEIYGLVFDLHDEYGQVIGYTSKNLKGRYPKSNTWQIVPGKPLLYIPRHAWSDLLTENIILVEGCLDAIKVMKAGWRAAALCGSNISIDQAKLLKKYRYDNIGLMLDADTWHHAKPGKLRDKYSLYFNKFILIPTDADPKDTPINELQRNINGWLDRKATISNNL